MKEPADQIDDELSEWEELLTADPNEISRRSLGDDTYSRWDVDAEDRTTPTHEELDDQRDTTLTYEIDESGRTHLKREMSVWEAIELTFGPDSYLSTKAKAAIVGAYAFALIGLPILAFGSAAILTAAVGSPMVWYGLAIVALAVFYIKWAAKILS